MKESPHCPGCHDMMSIVGGMNKKGVLEIKVYCEWCDWGTGALLVTNVKRSDIRKYFKGIEGEETRNLILKSMKTPLTPEVEKE